MTFEEWYQHRLVEFDGQHPSAAVVWNAAIEAAATKIVRGTNLYNISGDHISGQVIDSITQLKSS